MTSSHISTYDVLIAGAGPVGLFLACELRLVGVSVLILEQAEGPVSPLKALPFGMRGLSMPTLKAFHQRGLLEEVQVAQHANDAAGATKASSHWMQQRRLPGGHFAGIQFFHEEVDRSNWPYHLPCDVGVNLAVDMQSLETVLARRAEALGVKIRRGIGVESFEEAEDAITVSAGNEVFRGRWLVGCDGGRSTVRKKAGFNFIGTDPEMTGYSILAELADTSALKTGRTYTPTGMYTYAQPGTIAMVDFDGGAFHRTRPVTLDHAQAVLRRISGTDVKLATLHLATTWTDRACQATAYRKGRVLLAGDAAHIHSPLGGQGLNLGLGDAMNLGWKLGAVIRGDAPEGVLDSYFDERHPVGAQILDWSRAQVTLMRPTCSTRALEAIIRDLMATSDGATYFAERIWGASLRYNLGDGHPLVGRIVPDFELVDGTRLGPLLRDGKGLLLDFDANPSLKTLADEWRDQVRYIVGDSRERLDISALLVRPDGFVAWATNGGNEREAAEALWQWFGKPRAASG